MKRRNLSLLFVAIVLGAGLVFFQRITKNNVNNQDNKTESIVSSQSNDIDKTADFENKPTLLIGNESARAVMIEYVDFKCPNCNKHHQTVGARLQEEYVDTDMLKIEIRNYPFLGPDSGKAARGTYCANDQGALTSYVDNVFDYMWDMYYKDGNYSAEFEDILTVDTLAAINEVDLKDIELFKKCVESEDYNRFIDADLLLGADDEINGTPGFRVANKSIIGPQSYTTFKTLIDIALK